MKRVLALVCGLSACGGAPTAEPLTPQPPTSASVAAPLPPKDPLADPPASGVTPSAAFPSIARRTLSNGLEIAVVSRKTLPIVELRLLFRSGTASDGAKPGVAAVAGELTKAGGAGPWNSEALLERAESLGADLSVITDRDATRISLGVTTGDLEPALEIMSAVASKPRFDAKEFGKLRTREIERAQAAAKSSAGFFDPSLIWRRVHP